MAETTKSKNKGKSKLANMVELSTPITMISVDDLIEPLYYLERDNEEDVIRELAISIAVNGLLNPLIVKKVGKKYRILAGAHRFKAIQDIGFGEIPCRITKVTEAGEIMMTLAENINRFDVQPIVIAHLISELKAKENLTNQVIAEKFGKTESWVRTKLKVLGSIPAIQEKLTAGEITESHAAELSRLPTPELQEEGLVQLETRGMTVKSTRKMVDDFEEHQTLHPEVKAHEAFQAVAEEQSKPSVGECCFDKHEHLTSDMYNLWICKEHFELLKKVLMKDGVEFFHL